MSIEAGAPRYPRPADATATRHESSEEQWQAEALLPSLLGRIDEFAQLDNHAYFERDPMSSLAVDDAAIYPLQVSSPSHIAILSSIDHLMTVATIVRGGTLPMVALVSLLRSALETACVAIYFLAPDDRATRVLRILRDAYFQIADHEAMNADIAPDAPFDRDAEEDLVRRALAGFPNAGTWQDVSGGRASITKKVELACPAIEAFHPRRRAEFQVRGMWRGFSGMTHGRKYAALAILDREELAYDEETGVVTTRMTFGARSLVGTLNVVLDAVDTAIHLYGVRARGYRSQPEDTELATRLRAEGRI